MRKIFNFSPGPAMLPEAVLYRAQQELMDWQGCGMSVMEMSHRGKEFALIREKTESVLRALLAIPNHYQVLFLAGGATMQFSMVPINLFRGKQRADYIVTGTFSKKAAQEAAKYGQVNIAGKAANETPYKLPALNLDPNAAYCYYADNETIEGIEFLTAPKVGNVPLVSDMTSNILSKSIDVNQYGLIFASAQKNMGHAGITVVIVREDLMDQVMPNMPSLLNYQKESEEHSMLNTPPTYSWYFAGLMFDWISEAGGVAAMEALSLRKINKIYQKIDASSFYINQVDKSCRSRMNVPFTLANPTLDTTFLTQAHDEGLVNLAGHRSVGGMRASVYLGMPEEGVDKLVHFMDNFEKRYG